jgi:hypothetical protein
MRVGEAGKHWLAVVSDTDSLPAPSAAAAGVLSRTLCLLQGFESLLDTIERLIDLLILILGLVPPPVDQE